MLACPILIPKLRAPNCIPCCYCRFQQSLCCCFSSVTATSSASHRLKICAIVL